MTYGCHNRAPFKPMVETVAMEAALTPVNGAALHIPRVVHRSWPHVFTTDCQYTKSNLGKTDPQCVGCKWRESWSSTQ